MKRELSFRQQAIIKMPYPLLKLLIKYNCLRQFADNCDGIYHDPDYTAPSLFLLRAFIWKETAEGYNYWMSLYKELKEEENKMVLR